MWILTQEGGSSLGRWEGPGGAPVEGVAAEALPPKTVKKNHHTERSTLAILHLHLPSPHRRGTRRLFEKAALREVCADCKVHHTNTAGRVHAERHAIALPGHATCPMNAHQVPWCPALGSLKYRASAVHALALFHPCEPYRAIPSPPPSAPAVAWAPWLNDIQKIPSFHNCSLGAAAPPG